MKNKLYTVTGGKWIDNEDCNCTEPINLLEHEAIDALRESLTYDNTEVYVNNCRVK